MSINALLVAQREYLENVKTRGFWFSILLLPVLLLIVSVVPVLLRDTQGDATYAVLDRSGWVLDAVQRRVAADDMRRYLDRAEELDGAEELDARAEEAPLPDVVAETLAAVAGNSERQRFTEDAANLAVTLGSEGASIREPTSNLERFVAFWRNEPEAIQALAPDVSFGRFDYLSLRGAGRAALTALVDDDELLGFFVIPEDPVASGDGAEYVTRSLTNLELRRWFSDQVTEVVRDRRLREENIGADVAEWIQSPVSFATIRRTDAGTEARASIEDRLAEWAPVGFVYLLWISIFTVTQMLLTNTVEEKSNKLVEVLLSSISAMELMAGKILGIAATGLTIVAGWLLSFFGIIVALPVMLGAPPALDLAALVDDPMYLGSFVLYFLLGYFFYAALLCGLGSVCNTLKEAQNLMIPVQLLLIVPLVVMIPIGRDPDGVLAAVMSWIPPFTPFVMMNRAAMPPSWLTYVLTTALMLVSIYVALKLAARVFETGILMSGKPPKLMQVLALLKRQGAR